jgi:DNA-binding transcriptional ArsR family regulator
MQLLGDTQSDEGSDAQRRPLTAGEADELDRDRVFALLKNPRRRAVLRQLGETPTTTLSDLADRIAADENGTTPEQLSSSERKRVYVSLYQNHLPKLAEFDAIDYDRSRGDVRRRQRARRLQQYLDRLDRDTDTSRSRTIRSVGGLVGVVSLVGVVGLPEIRVVWGLVAAAALVGVSVYGHLDGDSPATARQWLRERLAALRR